MNGTNAEGRFAAGSTNRDPFENLPESELLNPAGYRPEFLRSILRSGALKGLFSSDSTAEGSLETVRRAAYHSVELALSLGITVSLFTSPVRRFAPDWWRSHLEQGFLSGGLLGGMMITEPGCGTDLMACLTRCRRSGSGYELDGTKHWAGLTGLADYWLVLARDEIEDQRQGFPSLNFFICRNDPAAFKVLKLYGTAGLRSIPYGVTEIHAGREVLAPLLGGNRVRRFRRIHGILHRSRISISAITLGACQRIAADTLAHVQSRRVFGRALAEYGQAQARLSEIEASRDLSQVLYEVACREATREDTVENAEVDSLSANVVKVVCTDLAFAAATSASQLLGGNSYRTDTYIGRATADLRPFRIFEGSNDVLCEAVWAAIEKAALKGGPSFQVLGKAVSDRAGIPWPRASILFEGSGEGGLPQGLRCLGGRILANAISLQWSLDRGLNAAACRPLVSRMRRDFAAAEANGPGAGLCEY
jgi:alkylation response protein AidB-like acyl-CoA dehydrogenase